VCFDQRFLRRFKELICTETASAVFKAYFDALQELLALAIERVFNEMLLIGVANATGLRWDPVEWAQMHSKLLLGHELEAVKHWIKSACDKQDLLAATAPTQAPEEWISWTTWRAPRLIYMQPSGTIPYDSETAWIREDDAVTRRLLETHSRTFVVLLESQLENITGEADVLLAKMGPAGSPVSGSVTPPVNSDRPTPVPTQNPANCEGQEPPRADMSCASGDSEGDRNIDASAARSRAVVKVMSELSVLRPQLFSADDYPRLRELHPDFLTFRVCEKDPDLKLKLENIQGHQQFKRFAKEIVGAHFSRRYSTIEKDWKKHNPNRKPRKTIDKSQTP